MAWNEPGGSGNKDPWGGRGNGKEQGPPDLDKVVKNIRNKFRGVFGGAGGSGESSGPGSSSTVAGIVGGIAVLVWAATGLYIVESAERGVVTRFGKYAETTLPGLHWHLPFPAERVDVVDIDQIRNVEIGFRSASGRTEGSNVLPQESLMLTQDENIIDIKFAIQYKLKDAKDYVFNVRDPDASLREAMESSVREVIGKSKMDFVLTEGQSQIADSIQRLTQEIIDRYRTGLQVTSVNLQSAQPPQEVKPSFDDAIKSREDRQRQINEADTYANDVIPKARGAAARLIEEANGYKARVVAEADGEASRFDQLVTEYHRAPEVTRQRMYIETMETVLARSNKVIVDTKGTGNMIYLPLDKMMSQSGGNIVAAPPSLPVATATPPPEPAAAKPQGERSRDNLRSREVR